MWFKDITAQKAFAVASLLLTSGVSAAAIPSNLDGPRSVSVVNDVATTTQITATGVDGKPTSVPVVDAPDCQFCDADDEDEQTDISGYEISSEPLESVPVITVPSNGDDPSDDISSKTTRQPATEVKRATTTSKDPKYERLEKTLGSTPVVNDGYAIKIRSERNEASGVSYVDHYLMVAGYVSKTTEGSTEYFKYDSACYDIQVVDGEIKLNDCGATKWYDFKATYAMLGKIKSGITSATLESDAKTIAEEMEKKGYNLLTNNCRDFVKKLYKKIKA
ncbi:hypothetical protein BO70DRAFT_420169 [Aspergillus heteromorphus CBS 117.55]|uniref:Uncharacterized protein n=1 Tax=Aspergillus heteromorphus CBS 117.55 TaxID=1448321 RepID=A0A317WQM5_9EURO|nr:uncharacterized protein BO70DRAFT_420169 [Aspergillus heteromorphus CBS 117.55]PWY88365.1 hypothetical protein BO70DRAFT_420169 [Aspergillus heteromorphus CBS 117.55]